MAVKTTSCCFPHAGGDVSVDLRECEKEFTFSPRRWGCFRCRVGGNVVETVFPTQVGMFPTICHPFRFTLSFPHAGGDVSPMSFRLSALRSFSPRRWGCFFFVTATVGGFTVFPTQVGMFLKYLAMVQEGRRFPHAGGDVSKKLPFTDWMLEFSPRRWGCFRYLTCRRCQKTVFPTQVGMFQRKGSWFICSSGFPHAGGDVSGGAAGTIAGGLFSPRRWGCFRSRPHDRPRQVVFPTQVGMFPTDDARLNAEHRFSPRRWGCFCEGLRSCR